MERHKKRIWGTLLLVCVALVFGGYSLYTARALIIKPRIVVVSPRYGETVSSPDIVVSGEARGLVHLSLFGRDILLSEEGHFEESLLLGEGYNIIELQGTDRFGREAYTRVEVVLHRD